MRGERRGPKVPHSAWRDLYLDNSKPELALQDSSCESRRSEASTSSCILAPRKNEGIPEGSSTMGTANPSYVIVLNSQIISQSGSPLAVIVDPQSAEIRTAYFNRSLKT